MSSPSIKVDVHRVGPLPWDGVDTVSRDVRRARFWARLLDSQFQFFGIRFGIDPLIGLIPVAGPIISALAGGYIIYLAWKHSLGAWVITQMLANLAIDWLASVIPWVGNIVDVFIRANLRNLALLETALDQKQGRR